MKRFSDFAFAHAAGLRRGIIAGWIVLMPVLVLLWAVGRHDEGTLYSLGQLAGLFATFFALTQFMLMTRILWIERAFGLDKLANFHRFNGYATLGLLLIHPTFIILSKAISLGLSPLAADFYVIGHYDDIIKAYAGLILFVIVAASSIVVARRKLPFEAWYAVHLSVYVAIILAAGHQFNNGGTFAASTAALVFWYALYAFVAVNVFVFRLLIPFVDYFRYRFVVDKVQTESTSVTSVYFRGTAVDRLGVRPGQFVFVRILAKGLWWQEHPYTVSMGATDDRLRISAKDVGGFSHALKELKAGTKVSISGPFGRFTHDVATRQKQLFVAGGIGITPMRAMLEQAVRESTDTRLVWSNSDDKDVPLKQEIESLATSASVKVTYAFSDTDGHIDADYLLLNVPDIRERDIYVCGPAGFQTSLIDGLREKGIDPSQIHHERFALAGE